MQRRETQYKELGRSDASISKLTKQCSIVYLHDKNHNEILLAVTSFQCSFYIVTTLATELHLKKSVT